MTKIFFLVLVGMLSISIIFAQEEELAEANPKTCLAPGSKCNGESIQCCKPTFCLFYANTCAGDGLIVPDQPQKPTQVKPQTCLPRGSKCNGSSVPCCKPTFCMFYGNQCVGDGLVVPEGYPYPVQG